MKDPYNMSEGEFKAALAELTTPEEVLSHAANIYDFMTTLFKSDCNDSVMREWAFQWWSDETNSDYSIIYGKWLYQE